MEELADGFHLLLVQVVGCGHDVFQVLQIAKKISGLYQILVYVIEITNQEFAPKVEIVQRLCTLSFLAEHVIKFAYQTDGVSVLQRRHAVEEVVDADVGGRPHGTVGLRGQVFVEEQTGSFVGENDGRTAHVMAYFMIKVFGDHLKECFHVLILYVYVFYTVFAYIP